MADHDYTIRTLQKLVQINSVNPSLDASGGGEKEIGTWIAGALNGLGIHADIDEFEPGRLNVTGILHGTGGGKSLLLNAHMDTVGIKGMEEPFSGAISGGKLYGRGAYDMKGGAAAMLGAAKALADSGQRLKGDLILSFVADEEYASIGAQRLVEKYRADAAIVTEPTGLGICLAHRGFGIFKVVTEGKTAHGGKHREGVDANTKMGLLLAELHGLAKELPEQKKHPLCDEASIHVPLIEGGRSLFIYSNQCTIHVERRTLPGETQEEVSAELNNLLEKVRQKDPEFTASLECVLWRDPYEIGAERPIVRHLRAAAGDVLGSTPEFMGHLWWEDSAIFGQAGMETVIMGPAGGGIHQDTEWVETESVVHLADILAETARRYCV
jgi:acetylornithine deacetylase